jgi:hypothetical protein
MRSIHDNNVYSYVVDCERKRIVLHTSFAERELHEFTDVVFSGVVAHYFEHVLQGNILFAIDEADIESIVTEYADLFEKSWRYGWPLQSVEYKGDVDFLVGWLRQHSVRAFKIDSSYGISGWVLATNYELIERDKPFVDGDGET